MRRFWMSLVLATAAVTLSASSLVVTMSGSKWSLYAIGGVIKCGITTCGGKQAIGTLPNGEGVYYDFPVAADLPYGTYIADQSFVGTGPNDATWAAWPSLTASATYCVRITASPSYVDGAGPHDGFSWGTDATCTNGGTSAIQSTQGTWLSNGVIIYFAHMGNHVVGDTWTVRYDVGTTETDWRGYLMTVPAVKTFAVGQTLTMSVQVDTTGDPIFQYHGDGDFRCVRPVTIRPYFQRGSFTRIVDDNWRWWAKEPYSFVLVNGSATITVPLQPGNFVQTWGKTGSSTAALTSAFASSLAAVGGLGAAVGGGCSYGHAANISQGTARLTLRSYTIQ